METIQNFFSGLDIWQIMSAFVFMIAIIDPFGIGESDHSDGVSVRRRMDSEDLRCED